MNVNMSDNKKSLVAAKKVKTVSPIYGQVVIGPPGSGKTTYCQKMAEFFSKINRKVSLVNLDPGNENITYQSNIDLMQLISVQDVMVNLKLGPNGALVYCMEYLEKNLDWLLKQLDEQENKYFIFDCPGQVELYTHHNSVRDIFTILQDKGYHLCTINLVDSHYCSEPSKFISTLLMSLSTMLQMGLPHINILSKADLLSRHEKDLCFGLDYYSDVLNLQYLLDALDADPATSRHFKLNAALVSLIEDYSLVSFHPLDVNKEESLIRLKYVVDKVSGYVFGAGEEKNVQSLLACAVGAKSQTDQMSEMEETYS